MRGAASPWSRLALLCACASALSIAGLLAAFPHARVRSFVSGSPRPSSRPPLTLTRSNTFTIAIFADLHFGEEEHGWGIEQDVNSTRVMDNVLQAEKPDFVVLNGDLITGENTFRENSSAYVDQIVQPLLRTRTPWASTYGNHDSKFNLSRASIYQAESRYELCYTESGDHSLPGITNYYLPVWTAESKSPALILWFFDSRGGASYQGSPPDVDDIPNWVAPEVASWFSNAQSQLRREYGEDIPGVAFVHIPPQVFRSAQEVGLDPSRYPGLNEDVPVDIQGRGSEDDAFVAALLSAPALHSVHVGHDHGDSWCSTWPGEDRASSAPFLCFAKHTGYGGTGRGIEVRGSSSSRFRLEGTATWVSRLG
ncbi:unnamed protein product [Parascedosporium putredinis]|uniref:Calcineurin-like phosphoesterase domain-containing protein n=1 Tax=Parascedosporium putredinis TaxID=1442378 RepID=A0A9P1GXD3_9PEZI|nr:unnamed protein product [Parascedosporium putredinis]CAI7989650.1 unnamed protein product [Parascedosporium putredinis]